MQFIDAFGTHAMTAIDMGGRADQFIQVDVASFRAMASQSIDMTEQAKIGPLCIL